MGIKPRTLSSIRYNAVLNYTAVHQILLMLHVTDDKLTDTFLICGPANQRNISSIAENT